MNKPSLYGNRNKTRSRGPRMVLRQRQRMRLVQRRSLIASGLFIMFCTIGLGLYFQFSKIEDATAATSGDYRSKTSGDWSNIGSWEKYNGSAWIAATSAPSSPDGAIEIQNGHSITITSSLAIDQVVINAGGQVDLITGKTLTIHNATGIDLDVAGIFNNAGNLSLNPSAISIFENGGIYKHNFTTTAGAIPTVTWSVNSTCEITGYTSNNTPPSGLNQTFGNFKWNCPMQASNINLAGTLTTIAGDFIIVSTGTSANELQLASTDFAMTISGNYNQSGGIVNVETQSGVHSGTINIGGNWSHTGGSITVGGDANTSGQFNFNKSGIQSFAASGNTVAGNVDFTVGSGSTLDMGTNIVKGRNFTASSGGIMNIGAVEGITSSGASGNVQVSGTRTFNTGADYAYNGSAAQCTGNGLPSTVRNLSLNNSSGLTLSNTTTISSGLSLTSGKINTGVNQLNITNPATTSVAGYSSSNYIIGKLNRSVTGSGSYDYPVGTSSNYELININLSAVTGVTNILGAFTNANPVNPAFPLNGFLVGGTAISNMLNYGYWTLIPNATITAGSYNVTVNEQGQSNTASSAASYAVIFRSSTTSSWESKGTHTNGTQNINGPIVTAVRTGLTSMGHFGIGYGSGSLPIELFYFNAEFKDNHVDFNWATATEINNDYFTIERSVDSKFFEEILRMPGAGNSTTLVAYNAMDYSPSKGMSYYRLKQTDYDGKFVYFPIESVNNESSKNELNLAIQAIGPNPFNTDFSIKYSIENEGQVEIRISNSSGQLVYKETMNANRGTNEYSFKDDQALPTGIYIINLISNGSPVTKKLIKQ